MKVEKGEKKVKIENDDSSEDYFHLNWFVLDKCDDFKPKTKSDGHFTIPASVKPGSTDSDLRWGAEHTVVIFFHGAGQSSLTWLPLFETVFKLEKNLSPFVFLTYDARGHGQTKTNNETDLSLELMIKDALQLIEKTCVPGATILLGGAVATHVAHRLPSKFKITGLMVIDVVEGTALEAMERSMEMIRHRPQCFSSVESAIDWCLKTKILFNKETAKVTVPGQLNRMDSSKYVWRANLKNTFSHWQGWFEGLSEKFVSLPITGKILLLGGTNRLDTQLTIAQMQGKFKLVITPSSLQGHFIHEDSPEFTARILSDFLRRNCPTLSSNINCKLVTSSTEKR